MGAGVEDPDLRFLIGRREGVPALIEGVAEMHEFVGDVQRLGLQVGGFGCQSASSHTDQPRGRPGDLGIRCLMDVQVLAQVLVHRIGRGMQPLRNHLQRIRHSAPPIGQQRMTRQLAADYSSSNRCGEQPRSLISNLSHLSSSWSTQFGLPVLDRSGSLVTSLTGVESGPIDWCLYVLATSVNWGTVANFLAAAGAVGAAVVALHIASRDRRDRQLERERTARAQARLVTVRVIHETMDELVDAVRNQQREDPKVTIRISNNGGSAVLGVVPALAYDRRSPAVKTNEFRMVDGPAFADNPPPQVIRAGCSVEYEAKFPGPQKPPPYTEVEAFAAFEDATGTQWRISTLGTTERTG